MGSRTGRLSQARDSASGRGGSQGGEAGALAGAAAVGRHAAVWGLWAHIKRSLANLTARALSELEIVLRRRLKALQYRHAILGGFLAGTGLALDRPN
ncbi:hypothetical protein AB0N21_34025 [Streptomyces sp. NPDC051080]|uniref:hypothetical protein n=1 Tax=Streptomyces sp. NPDC051080 TaxID=3157222 RepID=UPI0034226E5E